MAKLPTSVQRQMAAIDELYKQPAEPAPSVVEEPAPAPTETSAPESVEQLTAAPAPAAQAPATETTAPTPAPNREDPTWEHRYKTLQGLHSRNMDDFKERLRARDADIGDLRRQIAELQAAKPAPVVDPKDVETFGEDLISMVDRVVSARLGHTGAQAESRIAQLETRVDGAAQAAAQTAEGLFVRDLGAQVPDFETLDTDPGFLNWLAQPDEIYGEPRQNALTRAAQALNAPHVARIFNAYKATLAPAPTQPATPSAQSQLEKQVAPRASSSTAPVAPPVKRVFSMAEVQKYYDDVSKGRYRGREEERKREEVAINAALAENRIR